MFPQPLLFAATLTLVTTAPTVHAPTNAIVERQLQSLQENVLRMDYLVNLNCSADATQFAETRDQFDRQRAPVTSSGRMKTFTGFLLSVAGCTVSLNDFDNSDLASSFSASGAAASYSGYGNPTWEKDQAQRKEQATATIVNNFAQRYTEKIGAITGADAATLEKFQTRIKNEFYLAAQASTERRPVDVEKVLRSSLSPETMLALGKTLRFATDPPAEALALVATFDRLPNQQKISILTATLENSLRALRALPRCADWPGVQGGVHASEALLEALAKL